MNKLSILIATLPERSHLFTRMINMLNVGTRPDVEVIADGRGREIPTGQKRNDLISQCTGTHFVFVDDDDFVLNDYTNELANAIQSDPDVVTFNGYMTTNGSGHVDWIIRLGEKYEARQDADGITRYYRFPNHLCAFKKSKVHYIKFPNIWQQEDFEWARIVNDAKQVNGIWHSGVNTVCKSEVHIDKQLYHYDFKTRK